MNILRPPLLAFTITIGVLVSGCDDLDCRAAGGCETVATSSSTSSSSTTTTTTFVTTTTALVSGTTSSTSTSSTTNTLHPFIECRIIFRLLDDVDLSELEYHTDYQAIAIAIRGVGRKADCRSSVGSGSSEFNDRQGQKPRTLRTKFVTAAPDFIQGPTDIASCFAFGIADVRPDQLHITTIRAVDSNGSALAELPEVGITGITCEDISCRCGDGVQVCAEQCDDGNTMSGDGCSSDCMLE